MSQGKLITFEGGDGSGKTTQLSRTVAWLQAQGRDVLQTFEPGDTSLGKALRHILLSGEFVPAAQTELLLFLADRTQHVQEVIMPALEAGKWVVCDRYTDSTLAYQLAGRKLTDHAELRAMLKWAECGVSPDVTILLDLSVEDATTRMASRQAGGEIANRLDREKQDFHQRIHAAFDTIAQANPERVRRINANQDIDAVQADIQRILSAL